ncbi:MAG: A24 family peptidase [Pseudomonadota bacterium]
MAEADLPELGEYSLRTQVLAVSGLAVCFLVAAFVTGATSWPIGWISVSAGLGLALLVLAAYDLKAHILPNAVTLPLLLAGLAVNGLWPVSLLWASLGAICGYGLIAGLRWLWLKRKGIEAIGLGDAKMLAAGGAWVGASGLSMTLLIASGAGLLVALIGRSYFKNRALPFGFFLALGIWASWCFWITPLALII